MENLSRGLVCYGFCSQSEKILRTQRNNARLTGTLTDIVWFWTYE